MMVDFPGFESNAKEFFEEMYLQGDIMRTCFDTLARGGTFVFACAVAASSRKV